jgi:hypothetical protein
MSDLASKKVSGDFPETRLVKRSLWEHQLNSYNN